MNTPFATRRPEGPARPADVPPGTTSHVASLRHGQAAPAHPAASHTGLVATASATPAPLRTVPPAASAKGCGCGCKG